MFIYNVAIYFKQWSNRSQQKPKKSRTHCISQIGSRFNLGNNRNTSVCNLISAMVQMEDESLSEDRSWTLRLEGSMQGWFFLLNSLTIQLHFVQLSEIVPSATPWCSIHCLGPLDRQGTAKCKLGGGGGPDPTVLRRRCLRYSQQDWLHLWQPGLLSRKKYHSMVSRWGRDGAGKGVEGGIGIGAVDCGGMGNSHVMCKVTYVSV